jgi:transposase
MRKDYPWEVRDGAEDLYVLKGLSYEEVAREIGVALSTIKRWAYAYGWQGRRQRFQEVVSDAKVDLAILYHEMIQKARETKAREDVQLVLDLRRAVSNAGGRS